MVEHRVPGFLPSVHGLRFANTFPPGPTVRLGPLDPRLVGIGDATAGLCGGMALTARDLWAAGLAAPPDTDPPVNGSRRFRALVRRQVQSLDWLRVPLHYAVAGLLEPERPGPLARRLGRQPVRVSTVERAWPRVRAEIDAGRPCLLELVRVGGASPAALVQNHQVVAWAYDEDGLAPVRGRTPLTGPGRLLLHVYDPNHPGRDDVVLEIEVAADGRPAGDRITLGQSTGEPLLGFFRGPCPAPASVAAWR